jgi:hypothetical protein
MADGTQTVSVPAGMSHVLVGGSGENGISLVRIILSICREEDDNANANANANANVNASVDQAAELLVTQWPRGGPVATYREKIIHPHGSSNSEYYYGLPCSYLLLKDDVCIG